MLATHAARRVKAGCFVTGTDTGVGKTLVAACLVVRWAADYWKPVQTGVAVEAGDTETVTRLAALQPDRVHPPRHIFAAPLSPEAAAAAASAKVTLADFELPPSRRPIVVEGAGGVLVPLGGGALMVDLACHLSLPIVLVARTSLGTINHTLLSLEALRARGLPILGVVFSGEPNAGNRAAIAHHGRIPILADLDMLPSLSPAAIAAAAHHLPEWPTEAAA